MVLENKSPLIDDLITIFGYYHVFMGIPIIPTQNQEKEYKTKEYNEVPNILDSGFEMFDLIEVNSNRLETINSYVNDLKSYISQLNIDEIIPVIESYQKYNLETNEYNYIVNEINNSITK